MTSLKISGEEVILERKLNPSEFEMTVGQMDEMFGIELKMVRSQEGS